MGKEVVVEGQEEHRGEAEGDSSRGVARREGGRGESSGRRQGVVWQKGVQKQEQELVI